MPGQKKKKKRKSAINQTREAAVDKVAYCFLSCVLGIVFFFFFISGWPADVAQPPTAPQDGRPNNLLLYSQHSFFSAARSGEKRKRRNGGRSSCDAIPIDRFKLGGSFFFRAKLSFRYPIPFVSDSFYLIGQKQQHKVSVNRKGSAQGAPCAIHQERRGHLIAKLCVSSIHLWRWRRCGTWLAIMMTPITDRETNSPPPSNKILDDLNGLHTSPSY